MFWNGWNCADSAQLESLCISSSAEHSVAAATRRAWRHPGIGQEVAGAISSSLRRERKGTEERLYELTVAHRGC